MKRAIAATGFLLFSTSLGLGCAASDESTRKDSERPRTRVVIQQNTQELEKWRQEQQRRAAEQVEQERRARAEAERRAKEAEEKAALRAQLLQQRQQGESAQEARDRAQAEARRAAELETQLTQQQAALERQQEELRRREAEVAEAERARAAAEQKTKDALGQVANVREEARGLVVTLSGSVLFPSNEAVLLPDAQRRLDVVADALRRSHSDTPFIVEGHTDSLGSEDHNLELSRRRAHAVRDYLVDRGVPPDRVRAYGYGEVRPVASNTSAEGRANNRRVEIVLPREPAQTGMGGSGADEQGAKMPQTPP